MTVYALFRNGVHRHECGGIFDSEDAAATAARALLASEIDDYHDYEIIAFELNKRAEPVPGGKYDARITEPCAIQTLARDADGVFSDDFRNPPWVRMRNAKG